MNTLILIVGIYCWSVMIYFAGFLLFIQRKHNMTLNSETRWTLLKSCLTIIMPTACVVYLLAPKDTEFSERLIELLYKMEDRLKGCHTAPQGNENKNEDNA